jgi:3-isopropylmalate/(R)-2-methylmalate dehydratase small subunit
MDPFTTHIGRAVPLRRSNVDTDQIIPAEFLKRVTRTGFGDGLFSAWRKDPAFILNDSRYDGASVLLAGPDFGIGSSREHAVWALQDHGFRVVISSRFGDIFRGNSNKSGLLTVTLPDDAVTSMMDQVESDPQTVVTVDLEQRQVSTPSGSFGFEIGDYVRWRLMEGLDDIAVTLTHADDIASYESDRASWLPVTS